MITSNRGLRSTFTRGGSTATGTVINSSCTAICCSCCSTACRMISSLRVLMPAAVATSLRLRCTPSRPYA